MNKEDAGLLHGFVHVGHWNNVSNRFQLVSDVFCRFCSVLCRCSRFLHWLSVVVGCFIPRRYVFQVSRWA